jgi:hypothetical protein
MSPGYDDGASRTEGPSNVVSTVSHILSRRRRPHAEIRIESRHCVWVSGHGTRAKLIELDAAQRPPVWSSRQRAWCVSEQTARRLLAALEHAGWDLVVTGPRAAAATLVAADAPVEQPEPGRGLW